MHAGEMRQAASQGALQNAVASQWLPKLVSLRSAVRAALMSPHPELCALTSAMGSRSAHVLDAVQQKSKQVLLASVQVLHRPYLHAAARAYMCLVRIDRMRACAA
jgi:hypothetical protein